MMSRIEPIYSRISSIRRSFHLILFSMEDFFHIASRLNAKEGGSRILFICALRITLGCRAADSYDQIWDICAFASADIRFDFPLSTSAHRSVNSFARKDFTIPSNRECDEEIFLLCKVYWRSF